MNELNITDNVKRIQSELQDSVLLQAAAKTRSADQVREAIEAGVRIIGYNYVQEAETIKSQIHHPDVRWHMIGHLQKNKVNKAVRLFDMIETIDSVFLAELIDKQCAKIDKTMEVLLEINSGRESHKSGLLPEQAKDVAKAVAEFTSIRLCGVMTMGPWVENPESLRPYFRQTKDLFDMIGEMNLPTVKMTWLSMGMSDSYKIAVEEGANMIRLGTALFGPR